MSLVLLVTAALIWQAVTPTLVRSSEGELQAPYQSRQACLSEERCGEAVLNSDTGQIVMFMDLWIDGFIETGNGQEVVKAPEATSE